MKDQSCSCTPEWRAALADSCVSPAASMGREDFSTEFIPGQAVAHTAPSHPPLTSPSNDTRSVPTTAASAAGRQKRQRDFLLSTESVETAPPLTLVPLHTGMQAYAIFIYLFTRVRLDYFFFGLIVRNRASSPLAHSREINLLPFWMDVMQRIYPAVPLITLVLASLINHISGVKNRFVFH